MLNRLMLVRAYTRTIYKKFLQNKTAVSIAVIVTIVVVGRFWLFDSWNEVAKAQAEMQKQGVTKDEFDIAKGRFDAALEFHKSNISGLGTLATIVGGVVLYLNFRIANKNTKLTESRLITEGFSKAVEQLGSDKIEIRLGGIYVLERIAKDSPRDYWTIMEVLTSFVHERSPLTRIEKSQSLVEHFLTEQGQKVSISQFKPSSISADVQAVLTVIGRRAVNREGEINLGGVNLSRVLLSYANLNYVIFMGVNLSHASLLETHLNEAILIQADLSYAYLPRCRFRSAMLSRANLFEANLFEANLKYADLNGANLIRADLRGASIDGTNLSNANLSYTDLSGVKNWTEEQLSSAKLCRTKLPQGCGLDPDRDCGELRITTESN